MHCSGGCLCACGVISGVRPSGSLQRLIMLQVCGGSCSSLRGCNRAPPWWVQSPCWAVVRPGRPCCCSRTGSGLASPLRQARPPWRLLPISQGWGGHGLVSAGVHIMNHRNWRALPGSTTIPIRHAYRHKTLWKDVWSTRLCNACCWGLRRVRVESGPSSRRRMWPKPIYGLHEHKPRNRFSFTRIRSENARLGS